MTADFRIPDTYLPPMGGPLNWWDEQSGIFPPPSWPICITSVLHLWCCLDVPEGVLPHFEKMTTLGGREVLSV